MTEFSKWFFSFLWVTSPEKSFWFQKLNPAKFAYYTDWVSRVHIIFLLLSAKNFGVLIKRYNTDLATVDDMVKKNGGKDTEKTAVPSFQYEKEKNVRKTSTFFQRLRFFIAAAAACTSWSPIASWCLPEVFRHTIDFRVFKLTNFERNAKTKLQKWTVLLFLRARIYHPNFYLYIQSVVEV